MQENIQGPVELAGAGYTYRPNDKYEPGEYRRLLNMDITNDGTVVNRPSAQGYLHSPTHQLFRTIGTSSSTAAVTSAGEVAGIEDIYYYGYGTGEASWGFTSSDFNTYFVPLLDSATESIAGTRSSKELQFQGTFKYNDRHYLLVFYTFNIVATNTKYGCLLVLSAPGLGTVLPPASTFTYNGSILSTESWNISNLNFMLLSRPKFKVPNFILQGERLWFASEDTVYFSAATSPDNFASPSGGFFKFADMNIKKILNVGDLIYVFGDSSIKIIQYATDPNTDARVTNVSGVVGAEDAVVLGDSIYCIKPNALYEVRGTNVSKVMDLKIDFVRTDDRPVISRADTTIHPEDAWSFNLKLEAFNNSLYIIPRFVLYFANMTASTAHPYKVYYAPQNLVGLTNPNLDPQVGMYHLNMDNGALSQYVFGSNGVPIDCIYIPVEDILNQTRLLVLGYHSDEGWRAFSFGTRPRFYFSSSNAYYEQVDDFCLDACGGNGSELRYEIPIFMLWIRHFSPDNLRNIIKKFRRISLEANLPTYWDTASSTYKPLFKLQVWAGLAQSIIGDTNIDTKSALLNEVIIPSTLNDGQAISASYAYGINQRARQVDIFVGSYDYSNPTGLSRYGLFAPLSYTQAEINALSSSSNLIPVIQAPAFEVSDIRTYWSYLGRGTTGNLDKS